MSLIIDNPPAGDLLSDILQADAAVLLDRRGVLTEQIQIRGLDHSAAAAWLREAADELERT